MKYLTVIALFAIAACGAETVPEGAAGKSAYTRAAIAPQQFALVPCAPARDEEPPPCYVLAAGGKYFLMGAPDGARGNLLDSEIENLDGVLLFSLLPEHIEGLDTVRNTTWTRGRAQPLLVAGPEGTEAVTAGIDSAFEVPDAELFAVAPPPGGYDASLMKALEVSPNRNTGARVVNTGDLIVRGFEAPSGRVIYRVEYSGEVLGVGMCGGEADEAFLTQVASGGHVSSCNIGGDTVYFIE